MSANAAIRVDGVSKVYRRTGIDAPTLKRAVLHPLRDRTADRFLALDHVDFDVGTGEAVGVIGPNGSGKSTLLRLIGGLGKPTGGRIVRNASVDAMMSLGESFDLLLTGRENAFTAALLAGHTRRQARAKLDEIVAFSELEDFFDLPLRTYSDGMRLRLGFSVAVASDPEILLIDEVLSVGDVQFQEKCFERLLDLRRKGVTILLASHDESQVRRLCDRVVWLSRGRVQAVGTPEDVYAAYSYAMLTETQRRAAESSIESRHGPPELKVNENRFGTFEVEVAAVRVLRDGKDPVPSGASVGVEVELEAHHPVDDPIVGVSLRRDDGDRCLDLNSHSDGLALGRVDGRRVVTLWIDRLDVEPGVYCFDVGVYESDWNHVYDYHWAAYPLKVGPSKVGGFGPPHRWIAAG